MVLDVTKVCSRGVASSISMSMDFGYVSGPADEGQRSNSAREQEVTSPLFDEMLQVAEIMDYAFVHDTAHDKGRLPHFKIWRGEGKELFLLDNMRQWVNDYKDYIPEFHDYPELIDAVGFQDKDVSEYETLKPCERLNAISEDNISIRGILRYPLHDINKYTRAVDYTMPYVIRETAGLNLFLICNVINSLQKLMPYVDETASLTVKNKPVAPWQKYLNDLAKDMNESLQLISEIYEFPADLTKTLKAHTLIQDPISILAVYKAWEKKRPDSWYKDARKNVVRTSTRGRDV